MTLAYQEFVEFIAGGSTPQDVINFQPSVETKRHVASLIERQKSAALTPDETSELNQ